MPIVVLDGPEKAGKTTVARLLEARGYRYRHFSHRSEEGDYWRAMVEDTRSGRPAVWDRSWASESVYGSFFHRPRRLASDPWLGEWLFGRLARTDGLTVMMLGPSVEALASSRTPDDQPVPADWERAAFAEHAEEYGWHVVRSHRDDAWQAKFANWLEYRLTRPTFGPPPISPPDYVGPADPGVLVVGESRNAWGQYPSSFAPFTSWYTTRFGRLFGNEGLWWGWTNADVLTSHLLTRAPTVLAMGRVARDRIRSLGPHPGVHEFPHPAAFYRWGSMREGLPSLETRLKALAT